MTADAKVAFFDGITACHEDQERYLVSGIWEPSK